MMRQQETRLNPQPNPQPEWCCMTYAALGSPRMLVSCCKTISRIAVTAAFCSVDYGLLSFSQRTVLSLGQAICAPKVRSPSHLGMVDATLSYGEQL